MHAAVAVVIMAGIVSGSNDNGDKGQKGPPKEDTKDLASDDPKVEPNIPRDGANSPVCLGGCGSFSEIPKDPVKPLPNPGQDWNCIFHKHCGPVDPIHPPGPLFQSLMRI